MISVALKTLRTYHSMKQKELSARLNMSNSYLSQIEDGKKTPNLNFLYNYSRVFGIPVFCILFLAESIENAGKEFDPNINDKILKIVNWYNDTKVLEELNDTNDRNF